MYKIVSIAIVLSCLNSSCSSTESNEISKNAYLIPKDSLISLLTELHLTDAAAKQNKIPNNANNYSKYSEYKTILKKNLITKERFDSTLSVYCENPDEYEALYDKLIIQLKSKEIQLDSLIQKKK